MHNLQPPCQPHVQRLAAVRRAAVPVGPCLCGEAVRGGPWGSGGVVRGLEVTTKEIVINGWISPPLIEHHPRRIVCVPGHHQPPLIVARKARASSAALPASNVIRKTLGRVPL